MKVEAVISEKKRRVQMLGIFIQEIRFLSVIRFQSGLAALASATAVTLEATIGSGTAHWVNSTLSEGLS